MAAVGSYLVRLNGNGWWQVPLVTLISGLLLVGLGFTPAFAPRHRFHSGPVGLLVAALACFGIATWGFFAGILAETWADSLAPWTITFAAFVCGFLLLSVHLKLGTNEKRGASP